MTRLRQAVFEFWRKWAAYRQTPPKMEPEAFYLALRSSQADVFWAAVEQYIETAADTERLLKVKRELGMKGYNYLVGYIKGQRDIAKFVKRVREARIEQGVVPARPAPTRPGGIAKRVQ